MANDLANDHLPKPFQLDCESVPGCRRLPSYSNHASNRLQCTRGLGSSKRDSKHFQAFITHRTAWFPTHRGCCPSTCGADKQLLQSIVFSRPFHKVTGKLRVPSYAPYVPHLQLFVNSLGDLSCPAPDDSPPPPLHMLQARRCTPRRSRKEEENPSCSRRAD